MFCLSTKSFLGIIQKKKKKKKKKKNRHSLVRFAEGLSLSLQEIILCVSWTST